MTPDWAAKPTSVPYASFGDPQTLNLYSYVENGPLNKVDADGHTTSHVENFWSVGIASCITAGVQGCGTLAQAAVTDAVNNPEEGLPSQIEAQAAQSDAATQANHASANTATAQQQIGQDPTLPTAVEPPPPSSFDSFMQAIWPQTPGEAANFALTVGTDGLGELGAAGEGLAGAGESLLTRYGTEAQSTLEKLAGDAAKAEEKIGIHGVSTTTMPKST